jgi:hypothetical protein
MEEEIDKIEEAQKDIARLRRFHLWLQVLILINMAFIGLLLRTASHMNRFAQATNIRLDAEEKLSREQHRQLQKLIQAVNGCCQSEIEAPPPPAPPSSPTLPRNFLLEILGRKVQLWSTQTVG